MKLIANVKDKMNVILVLDSLVARRGDISREVAWAKEVRRDNIVIEFPKLLQDAIDCLFTPFLVFLAQFILLLDLL